MWALLRNTLFMVGVAATGVVAAPEVCSTVLDGEKCRLTPCTGNLNAQCDSGHCVCGPGTCAVNGRCEADGKTSLGDRLVLEIKYIGNASEGGKYVSLPLTARAATAQGWNVSGTCSPGRGREATNDAFASGALHLWYDNAGKVIGYEAVVKHRLNGDVCKKTSTGSRCAVMFRKEATACSGARDAVENVPSIGDRLLIPYWHGELPLTAEAAKKHSPPFVDSGNCLANMGHHFLTPLLSLHPVMTMYHEKSGDVDGLLIVDPIPNHEPTPPFEKFSAFGNVMSLHVYFKEHMGACVTSEGTNLVPPVHV